MQKLRIAILSYRSAKYGGGQGVYVRDISFALSLLGHDVDVISGPPYPNLHDGIKLIKLPGLDLFESFVFKDRLRKFLKRRIKIKMIFMNSLLHSSEDFRNQKHLEIGLINISDIMWIMMSL